jgi:hypothetical protein
MRRVPEPSERAVFTLLLDAHPTLLSRAEIAREIGTDVDRTLDYFERNGLVHRLTDETEQDFFWLTRPALLTDTIDTAGP